MRKNNLKGPPVKKQINCVFKYLGGCFLGFVESDKLLKGGERGTQTDITAGKISSVIKWGSRKAVCFWATESAVLFHIF